MSETSREVSPDVHRTIAHFYPGGELISPWENRSIRYEHDSKNVALRAIVAELEQIDKNTRPGTRGRYDVSEELEVGEHKLQLSYLGPFAALDYEEELFEDEAAAKIRAALERHGVRLLSHAELIERVPSLDATVWDCLFVIPEA